MSKEPSAIKALLKLKCPNCRRGNMFTSSSIFPLNKMMDMPELCPECGLKFELEPGFWFGTGYISYGMSVGLIIFMAVIFGFTYGFKFDDNSIFIFLGIAVGMMVLLQPILMRYSRAFYLRIFVNFGEGQPLR